MIEMRKSDTVAMKDVSDRPTPLNRLNRSSCRATGSGVSKMENKPSEPNWTLREMLIHVGCFGSLDYYHNKWKYTT